MNPTRRALLSLALGGFGIGTGEFVILGLLPNVASSLHVSIPHAGYLISAYALGVVVGAPMLTPVSVWIPRRRFLIITALAMAAGNVGSALMPNFDTLLVVRFLSGLPHGAFFGIATVVAGRLVVEERRSSAMAVVFAGLTVANVVGVPLTTLIGQHAGWRLVFDLVGLIEVATAAAIFVFVPADVANSHDNEHPISFRQELGVFRKKQLWLSLGVATIGGAGFFCTFSYITPMLIHLAGYHESEITPLLVLFGLGMTVGNLVGARFANRALMPTIYFSLSLEAIVAALFFFAAHNKILALFGLFLLPACAFGIVPSLQNRIIGLAGGAPNLAAASMQSAFNISNSIGAWVGGMVIAAGLGYGAPNLAAAGLALMGLAIAVYSGRLETRDRVPAPA